MIQWPFVSRKKYDAAVADAEKFRKACEMKQRILMHYKSHYHELHSIVYQPRDRKGRFIEKVEFQKCLSLK